MHNSSAADVEAEFEAEKLFHVKVVLEQKCKNRSHDPTKKWSSKRYNLNQIIKREIFRALYISKTILLYILQEVKQM